MHESRSPADLVPWKASSDGRRTPGLRPDLGLVQLWVWFAGELRIDRGEGLS